MPIYLVAISSQYSLKIVIYLGYSEKKQQKSFKGYKFLRLIKSSVLNKLKCSVFLSRYLNATSSSIQNVPLYCFQPTEIQHLNNRKSSEILIS